MRRSSPVILAAGAAVVATLMAAGPASRAAPAGDAAKGEAAFGDHCTQCHTMGGVSQGPDLAGVVGRKAGAAPDFPYSAAMRAAKLTWTPANLERFMANPQAVVPGTAMTGVSVASAAERANIVAYLAAHKAR